MLPRLFELKRKDTGQHIVYGVVWPDGYVHARWNAVQNFPINVHGSSCYESLEWFMTIHGRNGEVMEYLDEE